jgi:anti-sigma factor RsiW
MSVPSLTCRDLIEFLAGYLDGELDPACRERFDSHLAICPDCRRYLETYRETARIASVAYEDDGAPPPEVPEPLIRAILAARSAR